MAEIKTSTSWADSMEEQDLESEPSDVSAQTTSQFVPKSPTCSSCGRTDVTIVWGETDLYAHFVPLCEFCSESHNSPLQSKLDENAKTYFSIKCDTCETKRNLIMVQVSPRGVFKVRCWDCQHPKPKTNKFGQSKISYSRGASGIIPPPSTPEKTARTSPVRNSPARTSPKKEASIKKPLNSFSVLAIQDDS